MSAALHEACSAPLVSAAELTRKASEERFATTEPVLAELRAYLAVRRGADQLAAAFSERGASDDDDGAVALDSAWARAPRKDKRLGGVSLARLYRTQLDAGAKAGVFGGSSEDAGAVADLRQLASYLDIDQSDQMVFHEVLIGHLILID